MHLFDISCDEPTVDRFTLSGEVEQAMARGDLRLWFQPKYDLRTGHVVGAEGLLRWHHPVRGLLFPEEFLDVIELSRHFDRLTPRVVEDGITFMARTIDAGHPVPVSVNISIRDLLVPGFAENLRSMLATHGVPANMLMLEVTEREIMDVGMEGILDTRPLAAMGVGLSIDDFGTGYSSLVRLQQMDVSELKIERRFVSSLGHDESAPFLVRSIIDLARNLGLNVVAEGVEESHEAETLRSMGCTVAQGYLWSRAVPPDELLATLAATTVPT